jgi:Arm DNA-binding domain
MPSLQISKRGVDGLVPATKPFIA